MGDTTVHFILTLSDAGMEYIKNEFGGNLIKAFSPMLSTSLATSNMMLFDRFNQIKKFSKPLEILEDFAVARVQTYVKRREHMLKKLKQAEVKLSNQKRFVLMVVEKKLALRKRK